MEQPLNYIMHIPKTAGLSLQGLVRRRYKAAGSLALIYTQQEVDKGFEDRPELKTVMGHFPMGYDRFSQRPARYFCFLRDPLDQTISHYRYTIDHPEKFEFLPPDLNSLLEFAQCPYGYNLQTAYLSGLGDIRGREEEALRLAKHHLSEGVEMIGLTEEFDLSILMLAKALRWRVMYYVSENRGVARQEMPSPTSAERQELAELLQYDRELYRYAQELFARQKEQHPWLVRRLPSFRRANKLFQKLNPSYIKLKQFLP